MPDTTTTLTPSATNGSVTLTASANLFTSAMVGTIVGLKDVTALRAANTAYSAGATFYATDGRADATRRLYRVTTGGTTAAASMAGTTPNYDLAVPTGEGPDVRDGSAVLRYVGRGQAMWGYGTITAYTSATSVTLSVNNDRRLPATTATTHWRLGEWGGGRGWPRCMAFFQQRTVWGGSTASPQTVWSSRTGDYYTMSPTEQDGTVVDTNGISATLDAGDVNTLRWAVATQRGVVFGAAGGIFLFGPASNTNRVLTPSNIEAKRQSRLGSSDAVEGIAVENAVLYVQRGGRRVREFTYDFASDSYQAPDLSILAEHLTAPGIVSWAYQEQPEGVLWLVRADGVLLSLTYDRDQQVRAWCRHVLGGAGLAESVDVCANPDGSADDVYVSVNRNGTRTIEIIRAPVREDVDGQSAFFHVDCGLTYSGTPVNTLTGLDHLEGKTVQVFADGATRTEQVVTGGAVSIGAPNASVVHVGLGYNTRVRLLPIDAPGGGGTGQGRFKRVHEVVLRLQSTGAIKAGSYQDEVAALREVPFRHPTDAMGVAVPLFTGDVRVNPDGGWDRRWQFQLESVGPAPLTVLAIAQEVQTSG